MRPGTRKKPTEKSIVVLGDITVKHINGWDLAKKVKGNCLVKVYVKSFSRAKADYMIDYSKPSVPHDPEARSIQNLLQNPSLIWQFL